MKVSLQRKGIMTDKEIIKMRDEANESLDSYHITKAIGIIREMVAKSGLKGGMAETERISDTYGYMLHYLLEGIRDDGRAEMLGKLSEELRSIADMAVREVKTVASPEYYYSILRFNQYREERVSEILKEYGSAMSELTLADAVGNVDTEIRQRAERALERLFNTLYTSMGATAEYEELVRYLTSGYADASVAAQSVSALTLGLLTFWDKAKFNTLIDIYEQSTTPGIQARAMAGIVLSMVGHTPRIVADSAIMARLALWQDSLETYRHLRETIRAIVSARDTERIAAKMKDEVLPELMKLRPEILKSMKGKTPDPESMLENNPEWEEIFERSGLADKLKELSELQSDGADLMMVTFSNLKQFPFFNHASHWFLPFDISHTELKLDADMRKLVEMMRQAGTMVCDSDLYSLALATAGMPDAQRRMISTQFQAQLDQMQEELRTQEKKTSVPEYENEVIKSVRDLYRFFKLFRNKGGLSDPFARPLDFLSMPTVGDMMSESDVLQIIGEFYFRRGYYREALPLLEKLADEGEPDATLLEKIGFSYQSLQNYESAHGAYEKAALLRSPGPWLVKKLAYTSRKLGHHEEAARYYLQALDMEPDNASMLLNAGNSLVALQRYDEALQHYYHAAYLQPDSAKILKALAYAQMRAGQIEKSRASYSRLLEKKTDAADAALLMDAGHAALLSSDIKAAAELYRRAAENNFQEFELAFHADTTMLEELGADPTMMLLLLDSLRGHTNK